MRFNAIAAGTFIAAGAFLALALWGNAPHAASPGKVDAGLAETRQLLLLMDTDKNGKVSKQEFMNFMSAEFDRLDLNHDGELDVNELTRLRMRPPPSSPFIK